MAVDQGILDSVASANYKTLSELGSHSAGLAMQNAVAHQSGLNQIRELALGALAKTMVEMDPSESISVLKALSGNDVAQQVTSLLAALSMGQQSAKVAQTTPPPTGG
jgi:hypothetical protein